MYFFTNDCDVDKSRNNDVVNKNQAIKIFIFEVTSRAKGFNKFTAYHVLLITEQKQIPYPRSPQKTTPMHNQNSKNIFTAFWIHYINSESNYSKKASILRILLKKHVETCILTQKFRCRCSGVVPHHSFHGIHGITAALPFYRTVAILKTRYLPLPCFPLNGTVTEH